MAAYIVFTKEREHDAAAMAEYAAKASASTAGHPVKPLAFYGAIETLEGPEAAVAVRVRAGEISATDGPFIETKEHLAGIVIIEARDLNDAIRLAGRIPMARLGTIEVRPVKLVHRTELEESAA